MRSTEETTFLSHYEKCSGTSIMQQEAHISVLMKMPPVSSCPSEFVLLSSPARPDFTETVLVVLSAPDSSHQRASACVRVIYVFVLFFISPHHSVSLWTVFLRVSSAGSNSNKSMAKWHPVSPKGLDEHGYLWRCGRETCPRQCQCVSTRGTRTAVTRSFTIACFILNNSSFL